MKCTVCDGIMSKTALMCPHCGEPNALIQQNNVPDVNQEMSEKDKERYKKIIDDRLESLWFNVKTDDYTNTPVNFLDLTFGEENQFIQSNVDRLDEIRRNNQARNSNINSGRSQMSAEDRAYVDFRKVYQKQTNKWLQYAIQIDLNYRGKNLDEITTSPFAIQRFVKSKRTPLPNESSLLDENLKWWHEVDSYGNMLDVSYPAVCRYSCRYSLNREKSEFKKGYKIDKLLIGSSLRTPDIYRDEETNYKCLSCEQTIQIGDDTSRAESELLFCSDGCSTQHKYSKFLNNYWDENWKKFEQLYQEDWGVSLTDGYNDALNSLWTRINESHLYFRSIFVLFNQQNAYYRFLGYSQAVGGDESISDEDPLKNREQILLRFSPNVLELIQEAEKERNRLEMEEQLTQYRSHLEVYKIALESYHSTKSSTLAMPIFGSFVWKVMNVFMGFSLSSTEEILKDTYNRLSSLDEDGTLDIEDWQEIKILVSNASVATSETDGISSIEVNNETSSQPTVVGENEVESGLLNTELSESENIQNSSNQEIEPVEDSTEVVKSKSGSKKIILFLLILFLPGIGSLIVLNTSNQQNLLIQNLTYSDGNGNQEILSTEIVLSRIAQNPKNTHMVFDLTSAQWVEYQNLSILNPTFQYSDGDNPVTELSAYEIRKRIMSNPTGTHNIFPLGSKEWIAAKDSETFKAYFVISD